MNQIHSECLEIKEHLHHDGSSIDQAGLQEEIGDLLHAVFSLTVFCKLSPQDTFAARHGRPKAEARSPR